ncbi:MAG: hypothetical protein IPP74_00005, partial [Alphaproteobacteria bacterium]|nr:hypothetical protein [Alphaproteobacteria bacterium]
MKQWENANITIEGLINYVKEGDIKERGFKVVETLTLPVRFGTGTLPEISSKVWGTLFRSLPSRTLLQHLIEELTVRDPIRTPPESRSYASGLEGAPSLGKSHLFKKIGEIVHPLGAYNINCKDLDLKTLFCETVFDTDGISHVKDAIDARLKLGNLPDRTIDALKKLVGDAMVEQSSEEGSLSFSIDWQNIPTGDITVDVFEQALFQICNAENIQVLEQQGKLGISTRDGILIRVVTPGSPDYGRPVLLDELNLAIPDSIQHLYGYLELLTDPKKQECEVDGGKNRKFTFRRRELPSTFHLNFTGNIRSQGFEDRQSISDDRALATRLQSFTKSLSEPTLGDFQDRIAHTLAGGVPLFQLYETYLDTYNKFKSKDDIKEFAQFLGDVRVAGIPDSKSRKVTRWKQHLILSSQLAQFITGIRQMVDVNSDYYTSSGNNMDLDPQLEKYLKDIEIDLRTIAQLIQKAGIVLPRTLDEQQTRALYKSFTENTQSGSFSSNIILSGSVSHGQRLENVLLDWVHTLFLDGPVAHGIARDKCIKLYNAALLYTHSCGIGQAALKEALPSGKSKPVRDLYKGTASIPKKEGARSLGVVIGSRTTTVLPIASRDSDNPGKVRWNLAEELTLPTLHRGDLATDQVYGRIVRSLPSETVAPMYTELLANLSRPNRHYVTGLMGTPAIGKTFTLMELGKALHPQGSLYMNGKGKDLRTLFQETVFDTNGISEIKAAIDAHIFLNRDNPETIFSDEVRRDLKALLGFAYQETISEIVDLAPKLVNVVINWNAVECEGITPDEQAKAANVLKQGLHQIAQKAGINVSQHQGDIGITTRDGILIRALDPSSPDFGRPIVLDEFNLAKEGSIQSLYELFLFLNDPNVSSFSIRGGKNKEYHFTRDQIPATFHFFFTGNYGGPGRDESWADKALKSRLDMYTVPLTDPTAKDIATRIAQTLTGVPLRQIYKIDRLAFRDNPELFKSMLLRARYIGLTEEEIQNTPEVERFNIDLAASDIRQMSKQLGQFFAELNQLTKPDSASFPKDLISMSLAYENYLNTAEIDLRTLTNF